MIEPTAVALMIADDIYTDSATRKHTLLGTFSGIASSTFPAEHRGIVFYLALTDGPALGEVVFRVVDAEEEADPLVSITIPVELKDPLLIVEIIVKVPVIAFPKPGVYFLQAAWNGAAKPIIERRLPVLGVPPQEPPQ